MVVLNIFNFATSFAKGEISMHEIPDAIITYAFLSSTYYENFSGFLKSIEGQDPTNRIERLHQSLKGFSADIPTRIRFPHRSFVVYSNPAVQDIGFPNGNDLDMNSLFITTPLMSFDNKVLVVFSSVAPQQTTIFSVDENLKVDLIYDSIKKHTFRDADSGEQEPMASIYQIRNLRNGTFLLKERKFSGVMGGGGGRTLILDPKKSTITIQRLKGGKGT
jgi:hypothetical protein